MIILPGINTIMYDRDIYKDDCIPLGTYQPVFSQVLTGQICKMAFVNSVLRTNKSRAVDARYNEDPGVTNGVSRIYGAYIRPLPLKEIEQGALPISLMRGAGGVYKLKRTPMQ